MNDLHAIYKRLNGAYVVSLWLIPTALILWVVHAAMPQSMRQVTLYITLACVLLMYLLTIYCHVQLRRMGECGWGHIVTWIFVTVFLFPPIGFFIFMYFLDERIKKCDPLKSGLGRDLIDAELE